MKTIELTEKQREAIALDWIEDQQDEHDGYKKVVRALFGNAYIAVWSWSDALAFAVRLCSKEYAVSVKNIKDEL